RRFVLDPVVELQPDFVHPTKGISVEALRRRLLVRPLTIALAGDVALAGDFESRVLRDVARGIESADCRVCLWTDWQAANSSSDEPTFVVWCGHPRATATPCSDPGFLALPTVPRIDARCSHLPLSEFLDYLIDAALGPVECVEP